jgi:crotonobetainyl-CoA:carnitine CoA-transferase CaiB-like acyl-CoA transferase
MRLADMGARVIKIERPGTGDIGRTLAFAGLEKDGDTLSFHIMNRNKESFAADLKNSEGLAQVWELVKKADVIIQNFRPGVIERLGLGYEDVKKINPRIIYGSATGYGAEGPFKDRPGQDLLHRRSTNSSRSSSCRYFYFYSFSFRCDGTFAA